MRRIIAAKKGVTLPKINRRYVPLKLIGRGSFGVVYLVRRQADSRQCVMKLIDMACMSEKDRSEATNECDVLQRLRRHPHIIRILEHFSDEQGKLCIVMDFADGGDLSQRIEIQKQAGGVGFPEEQVLDWFVQVCLALKHAHDRKVMHRDLKPQNIFLTRENFVRLGDFGISKVLGSTMSVAHTCVGTPLYLAPELCKGDQYNNKCDVWSLGVILYELLTLRLPFHASNMPALIMQIVGGNYAPLPAHTHPELQRVIAEALEKDPAKRPRIHDILERDFVKERITRFLDQKLMASEFSHTIIHLSGPGPCNAASLTESEGSTPALSRNPSEIAQPAATGPAAGTVRGGGETRREEGDGGTTRRSVADKAAAIRSASVERARETAALSRALDAAQRKGLQAKYDEERAKIRRDRLMRQKAAIKAAAEGRGGEDEVAVLVPSSARPPLHRLPPSVPPPQTSVAGGGGKGAEGGSPDGTALKLAEAVAAANPTWRLLTDDEVQERLAGLNAQRAAVMSLVEGCALTGEPARQLINSAQREIRQIRADIQKLRCRYVLVPASESGPFSNNGSGREAPLAPGAEGEAEVSVPAGVRPGEIATLFEPRDPSDDELGSDLASLFQVIALVPPLTGQQPTGGRGGSGAAGSRNTRNTTTATTTTSSSSGDGPSLVANPSVMADEAPGARVGRGGFAWVLESNPVAAERTLRTQAPGGHGGPGRRSPRGQDALTPALSSPAAQSAEHVAVPRAASAGAYLLKVPTDASLRDKGLRLREILAHHLGGKFLF